jgi:hypothetical protein
MSGFDVKVEEIKHDSMRKIAKTSVVNNQPFSSIYHLFRIS